MARKVKAFLTTVCLLFAVEAKAISGNQWRQQSPTAQIHYINGVLDAWDVLGQAALLAKEQSSAITTFTKLYTCATGMTFGQIDAIVRKYIENHPAEWHESMALLVWSAFNEVCAPKSK